MITPEQCFKKFGSPADVATTPVNELTDFQRKHMVLWDVPDCINKLIPALPNKIYCHKVMVNPLEQAFINICSRGLTHELKTWDGCYNVRFARGLNVWSIHSWGLAIDINAAWNQLGKQPTMSRELVQCFTDAGFDWGGTWYRKDGMHFQLSKI